MSAASQQLPEGQAALRAARVNAPAPGHTTDEAPLHARYLDAGRGKPGIYYLLPEGAEPCAPSR